MERRDRLMSESSQARISRGMQILLVIVAVYGLHRRSVGTVINSLVGLVITFLPSALERDYEIPMDARLTLWITSAIFLHAVGTLGPYSSVWWWDHVTHTLSAAVVAGAGYSTVRALDIHSDEVEIPPRLTFVFVLVFVVAFGVTWEVLEFGVEKVGEATCQTLLTQYSLEDTMKDLIFDIVGGVIVGIWGTAYLTDVIGGITSLLEDREEKRE
ncbi:hypothetical protein ACEU6E_03290 [Halorutilales archaeon Cl-col2-1]